MALGVMESSQLVFAYRPQWIEALVEMTKPGSFPTSVKDKDGIEIKDNFAVESTQYPPILQYKIQDIRKSGKWHSGIDVKAQTLN